MPTVIFFDLGDTLITKTNDDQHHHPFGDALDTLKALKERGYHLGLLSGCGEKDTIDKMLEYLERLGISSYIERNLVTISSEISGNIRKPDKRIFDLALEKSESLAAGGQRIFITENFCHIVCARTYDWRAIVKDNSGECKPDKGECISSLSGLLDLL
jgi:FMN phosphatase YigB (HAD superfamily)